MPSGHRLEVKPGDKFHALTLVSELEKKGPRRVFLCRCDCGRLKPVALNHLRFDRVKSCGCITKELISRARTSHGACRERLHTIWNLMRYRCSNPSNDNYPAYGGRGISVCEEWLEFSFFQEWAVSNGYRDDLTLDRINNDGDYEPGNCRWATHQEQARNTRRNRMITFGGETKPLVEWAETTGLDAARIRARLDRLGWSIEDALTLPIRRRKEVV